MRYITTDGTKRVTTVVIDGRSKIRVEQLGRGGHWYLMGYALSVPELKEYVNLADLIDTDCSESAADQSEQKWSDRG